MHEVIAMQASSRYYGIVEQVAGGAHEAGERAIATSAAWTMAGPWAVGFLVSGFWRFLSLILQSGQLQPPP